jgi:gag-polypeptide of LTR copia-type
MWIALIRNYKGNDMLKKAKDERLQSMFESFRIDEHESIEDMYTRFIILINEFIDVGDPLPTNKVVTKLIRVMMVRPSWRGYVGLCKPCKGVSNSHQRKCMLISNAMRKPSDKSKV